MINYKKTYLIEVKKYDYFDYDGRYSGTKIITVDNPKEVIRLTKLSYDYEDSYCYYRFIGTNFVEQMPNNKHGRILGHGQDKNKEYLPW